MEFEEKNGVRFSWTTWPSSKVDARMMAIPIGCLYTPLKTIPTLIPPLQYEPLKCRTQSCGCVLNPYCQVDFRSKIWTCPFCLQRNPFPPSYQGMNEQNLPAELIDQFTTLEYILPSTKQVQTPAFIFLIDTCMSEEDLGELKDSLRQTLNLLPEESLIGIVSFGTLINIHEVGSSEFPKTYVFRGTKQYTSNELKQLLCLGANITGTFQQLSTQQMGKDGKPIQQNIGQPINQPSNPTTNELNENGYLKGVERFVAPLSEVCMNIDSIIEDLCHDSWPYQSESERQKRCTGGAVNLAVSLLEACLPKHPSRILLFTSGPCTDGPGQVVELKKEITMRSTEDLKKGKAAFAQPAQQFYSSVGQRACNNNTVIDVFVGCYDQVGTHEMKPLFWESGGLLVSADSFKQIVFKESLKRVFRRYNAKESASNAGKFHMGFKCTIEVNTSREFTVNGALGPCSSMNRMSTHVSEREIGVGKTDCWKLGGIDPNTTLGFVFEVTNNEATIPANRKHFLQFITKYQDSEGKSRMRVTTCAGQWSNDKNDSIALLSSFDQETAAVLMARIAVWRLEQDSSPDVLRWLDRSLIQFATKFGTYKKDEPNSFSLPTEAKLFPHFMFHLRRSQYIQRFNVSPDENITYSFYLMRENATNGLVMIQPALFEYSFTAPPHAVLLDAQSVNPDTILLMDTFFHVVVFHGNNIAQWRDQGYHSRPDYAHFKTLLEVPDQDAQTIMAPRFPVPRYITCDQYRSQARFLLAKLNPSNTHSRSEGSSGTVIATDDVSLRVFLDHLQKLAVQT